MLRFYERRSLPTPLRHAANSGAILQLPESYLDMVRPGILFYGASPSRELAADPAREAGAALADERGVLQGGAARAPGQLRRQLRVAQQMTRVITLPVGYGDGYARAMSGKAEVIVRGARLPVVGRICMDQVMVDIGWSSAFNGDEVVLLGSSASAEHPHRRAGQLGGHDPARGADQHQHARAAGVFGGLKSTTVPISVEAWTG